MSKHFPLQSLSELSQLRLDEATRRLGELIGSETQANQRLELLMQYRDEYQTRFLDAARDGLGPEQWRNFRVFLEKLDFAIDQAREMVAQMHQRTTAGQQDWLQHRGRVKAFDTLAQRHHARQIHAELRQDQKELDEHSANKHHSRPEKP